MWDQTANRARRTDRNRAYDGSFSGRTLSFAGRTDAERAVIHDAILAGDIRILVKDGVAQCPEGRRLLQIKQK
jgi:hypothetical protein